MTNDFIRERAWRRTQPAIYGRAVEYGLPINDIGQKNFQRKLSHAALAVAAPISPTPWLARMVPTAACGVNRHAVERHVEDRRCRQRLG